MKKLITQFNRHSFGGERSVTLQFNKSGCPNIYNCRVIGMSKLVTRKSQDSKFSV